MEPTFAERLTHWLAVRGMRPAELARTLGVSRPTMHEWKNGKSAPRGERLPAIAAALGLTQAEFYGPLPELPVKESAPDGQAA